MHQPLRCFIPECAPQGVLAFEPIHFHQSAYSPVYPAGTLDLVPAQHSRLSPLSQCIYYEQFSDSFVVGMRLNEPVDFYGCGEVADSICRNGSTVLFWNTDNFTYEHPDQPLYQSHPYIMGLRSDGSAFAMLVDCTYAGKITIGTTSDFAFTFEAPGARFFLFEAENPKKLLEYVTAITGHIELPPLWALGYQQCRWSYKNEAEACAIAQRFRDTKIPCDALWFDIDYMRGFRIFTFDKHHFPDPKRMNDSLHDLGFKTVYMIDPGIKVDSTYDLWREGRDQDHFLHTSRTDSTPFTAPVWPGNCHFPDFTRPATRQWWAHCYRDFLATGIDGVWNDMNEIAYFGAPDGQKIDMNKAWRATYHRGGGTLEPNTHVRYHNIYGLLMTQATREGIRAVSPEKRPFVLSRASFIGGHRYAAMWTGDNRATQDHLRLAVPMILSMGLSAQPFSGADIPGFYGKTTQKLAAQWFAYAPFYPLSRGHTTKAEQYKEPFAFGPKVEKSARLSLQRRYKLLPYIYTLFEESSRTGVPIMRPLFYLDPKNPAYRHEDAIFMFGDDLCIVPPFARERNPVPHWPQLDVTGHDAADTNQLLIFMRPGSIVPLLADTIMHAGQCDLQRIEFVVAPDENGCADGVFYADDGEGYGYKAGEYVRAEYHYAASSDGSNANRAIRQTGGRLRPPPMNVRFVKQP